MEPAYVKQSRKTDLTIYEEKLRLSPHVWSNQMAYPNKIQKLLFKNTHLKCCLQNDSHFLRGQWVSDCSLHPSLWCKKSMFQSTPVETLIRVFQTERTFYTIGNLVGYHPLFVMTYHIFTCFQNYAISLFKLFTTFFSCNIWSRYISCIFLYCAVSLVMYFQWLQFQWASYQIRTIAGFFFGNAGNVFQITLS